MLRGVGIATVAAVAVTGGAAALAGPGETHVSTDGTSELSLATQRGAAVPVPLPVAAVVPAPAVPVSETLTTAMLDTGLLSDAVKRAQGEAARLADGARAREAEAQAAAERAEQAAKDADSAEEDRRTAEQGRRIGRIGEPDPKPAATADCGLNTGQLGAVRPFVRTAAQFLGCAFDKPTVLGVAGRSNASDHPSGRALDFMVDRVTGDQLAACAVRNREALGISYVIWRQRIDTGNGFRAMEDRGSATANHLDHVHVSFKAGAAPGSPISC